jgi:hypothetical protein
MNTTHFGSIGEAKTITKLMEMGFDVFTPAFDRNTNFDLIAYLDGALYKIQVKSTATLDGKDSYMVHLRSCRPNNTSRKVKHFDPSLFDILAVYIKPLDTVCFIDPSEITNKSGLSMREQRTKHANGRKQWIISDYLEFPYNI